MDVNRAAKCPGKYPPLATDTKVNNCFSKNLNNEIMLHKKMTLINLFCNDYSIFGGKSRASCAELNKKGYSEFE